MHHLSRRIFLGGGAIFALSACTTAEVLRPTVALAQNENGTSSGDAMIARLEVTGSGSGPTYIALHENETTSVDVAKEVIGRFRGTLIELKHSKPPNKQRNLTFIVNRKKHVIDPNRMFTDVGIKKNLSPYSLDAHAAVAALAAEIKKQLRGTVIALHNNTNGSYSFTSYQQGGSEAREVREVHPQRGTAEGRDADDFFFTTHGGLFSALRNLNYNVALQSRGATDDGSLSVYCQQRGIPYVNVEAEHGHHAEQVKMLVALLS